MILTGHLFNKNLNLFIDYSHYLGPDWSPSLKEGAIVISNHISWLDDLTSIMNYFPRFVARGDVKTMFAIGSMADSIDCIYVNRQSKNSR
jgi:1-acyl-sn-glycerol-3-phosphate acyltransferase